MHRIITKITPKNNMLIEAIFADGEIVDFDVSIMIEKHPEFKVLENKTLFDSIKVDGIGYGVSWNDELDLSSDGIYLKGKHVGKTDPDPKILLGQAIADAREEKNMSQRELSRSSGIMQAEISKIEQGKGNPTLTTLQKLAKSLGRTIASLLM